MPASSSLSRPRVGRWLILAIVSSALLLIVIDMTVLYTALPRLTHDLGASPSEKLWIMNAYALVVAGLLPGAGTLGDRLGPKRLFLAGLVVFGAASLVAAFAPSPGVLIGARALLAVGAAMMMPATLSILRHTFEDERERALAIGIWASVASGGAAFGPVVGGILLEHFWWGSVFLINLPIVLVALLLGWRLIPRRPGQPDRPWDLVASVQIMVALIALAYAIKETARRVPSYEAAAIAGAVGAVALALFVRRQRRSPAPLIDFALFRLRRFSAGVGGALVASIVLVGVELAVSQRLQLVAGLSPLQAGLAILPIPLAAFLTGPLSGLAVHRVGAERVLWGALVIAAVGLALAAVGLAGDGALRLAGFTLLGLGVGGAMTAASSAIMLNAPPERAGMAASIEEVSFELGAAIGIAVLGSLMSAVYTARLALPDALGVDQGVRDGIDEALLAAQGLEPQAAQVLTRLAQGAFDQGVLAVLVAGVVLLLAAAGAVALGARGAPVPGLAVARH
ncbi:MFS transporter [Zavarzinia sp. CC-PAN008]|uniref:MFS transporter n=1 Tax=Zavarzinia sp. CC-PAN008 TaxID=3243332 RepID=UPI003F74A4BA